MIDELIPDQMVKRIPARNHALKNAVPKDCPLLNGSIARDTARLCADSLDFAHLRSLQPGNQER